MAKLNNVEIHFKHSNRTYSTMTAFLVMLCDKFPAESNLETSKIPFRPTPGV